MKYILRFSILMTLISCSNSQKNESIDKSLKNENKTKSNYFADSLLKTTWFEIEGDDANFQFDDKFAYFTDKSPISYSLVEDSLFIKENPVLKYKIVKLTKDSLWLKKELHNDTLKLFTFER